MTAAAAAATARCLLLLVLVVAGGVVQAAQMLSARDAHWLKVLAPHARSGIPGWAERHEELAAEVAAAAAAGGKEIVVYGDSIMEAWRGQSVGYDDVRYTANKAAWELNVTSKHKAAVIAIAGDQTVHLLWRLRNGEGPQGLRPQPRLLTLMIGTNDVAHLGSTPVLKANTTLVGHLISLGAQECVWELQRQAPQATIVVFALLPLQPLGAPQHMFESFVAAANADLQAAVRGQESPKLQFKDGIHPSVSGAQVLLQCMLEAIDAALPGTERWRRRRRR